MRLRLGTEFGNQNAGFAAQYVSRRSTAALRKLEAVAVDATADGVVDERCAAVDDDAVYPGAPHDGSLT